MGVLADIDQRFAALAGSRELEETFGTWQSRRGSLSQFQGPEEMVSFLRDQEGSYEEKNRILWSLCEEARIESEHSKKGERAPRTASDLLVGLFSGEEPWHAFILLLEGTTGTHFLPLGEESGQQSQDSQVQVEAGRWPEIRQGRTHLRSRRAV